MINFDNVTKVYPNQSRPALESVNISVAKGEFVFLVGPSGSGKSTFLRLVLKEERPSDGRIHVAGRAPALHHRPGALCADQVFAAHRNPFRVARGLAVTAM